MNAMCDMSQSVAVVHITNEYSATLAQNCFQHMLMKFGLYHLVIMDDGTSLKFSIVSICKTLDLNYDARANRNHKGLTVEHFHHFLNKAVTVAMEDRQSNDIFVPAEITAEYKWHSASIDGTDILRNTIAIGR